MDTIELSADKREILGKKVRFLRRQGLSPVNLRDKNNNSIPLQIDTKEIVQALVKGGRNTVLTVKVNGERNAHTTLIRDVQLHPMTDDLLHLDLHEIDITEAITTMVQIELVGESPALRGGELMVSQFLNEVEVEGLPMEIPREIPVDASLLVEPEQEIRVKDLAVPTGIKILTDPEELVARLTWARIQEGEIVEEEAEVEVVGKEEAEGKIEPIKDQREEAGEKDAEE